VSNTTFGTSRSFVSPTSTGFDVLDEITLHIDADTGGNPFVRLNSFEQTFRAVPEPDSIAMLMTGLLAIGGLVVWRRRSDASSI
jgi:hypothetical protein